MNIGVIKAYILKEFKDLIRSKMILLVYILPTLILILFGYGIKLEVKQARMIIINYDKSPLSYKLISKFKNSKYFSTVIKDINENKALKLIKAAKKDILLIIPSHFERDVFKKNRAEIGVFIDGAFPLRATTMQSYVKGVVYSLIQDLLTHYQIPIKQIVINQRNLFNQALRDENAIVPGLIGLVLLVAPAILAALMIVKEKERGTIFNFYSSPVKKSDFLIAKLTPVFILHSLNIFILFLLAIYLFKLPFRGSFFIYWLSSEIYLLISLSIGLLVSIVTKRQIEALILSVIITVIPGFIYSGILMPISSMAKEAYIEAHIFPVMYYNHIIYDTFLIGQGFKAFKNVEYMFILILYSLILFILGSSLLKKELR